MWFWFIIMDDEVKMRLFTFRFLLVMLEQEKTWFIFLNNSSHNFVWTFKQLIDICAFDGPIKNFFLLVNRIFKENIDMQKRLINNNSLILCFRYRHLNFCDSGLIFCKRQRQLFFICQKSSIEQIIWIFLYSHVANWFCQFNYDIITIYIRKSLS